MHPSWCVYFLESLTAVGWFDVLKNNYIVSGVIKCQSLFIFNNKGHRYLPKVVGRAWEGHKIRVLYVHKHPGVVTFIATILSSPPKYCFPTCPFLCWRTARNSKVLNPLHNLLYVHISLIYLLWMKAVVCDCEICPHLGSSNYFYQHHQPGWWCW